MKGCFDGNLLRKKIYSRKSKFWFRNEISDFKINFFSIKDHTCLLFISFLTFSVEMHHYRDDYLCSQSGDKRYVEEMVENVPLRFLYAF